MGGGSRLVAPLLRGTCTCGAEKHSTDTAREPGNDWAEDDEDEMDFNKPIVIQTEANAAAATSSTPAPTPKVDKKPML
eukprot:468003-Rhodomonas_salina.2